jgi:HK97 family phage portal protein
MARFRLPWSRDEKFSAQWSVSDPAFAAWWSGIDDSQEAVTPYTVMGLSSVIRAMEIITVIATFPLKTYERQGDETVRIPSEFDDPYPGQDGMTPFEWVETVLMHLLLWRNAYLWHEARADGTPGLAYRPIHPDTILKVYRKNGRKVFEYRESGSDETKEVGSEQITHIPGPSIDGVTGHPLLYAARAIFSAAISADRTTQRNMRTGIRLAGVVTPRDPTGTDDSTDFDATEGKAILEQLRASAMGSDNAGDIAVLNRRVQLDKWTSTNIEAQWHETLMVVLMEIEQLFGVPPHLMADTEKQTSWGTGVAEQNLSLARFTLRKWSERIDQRLTRRLPDGRIHGPDGQFVEFDYKAFLQGTPQQEIETLAEEIKAGILDPDEARKVINLPPRTPAQKTASVLRSQPALVTDQESQ